MTERGFEGRRLGGRYQVGRLLGRGAMGAVYEAVQGDLGRRVAVKVLHQEPDNDPVLLQRFRREAQAAAALGHPNIAQVTDFQVNEGEPPFLVMEYLDGESLRDVLRREVRLDPRRVAFIFAQVLSALSAAHHAGIIHRDIKPANIMLTNTLAVADLAKVLDFGVAKLLNAETISRTAAGTILGTLRYMAPEQAAALDVDARTDIYAVGACMFRAIAGRPPIEAPSAGLIVDAIFHSVPPFLRTVRGDIDHELAAIVACALEKDPARRFGSAAEMASALTPWARSSLPGSAPDSISPSTVRAPMLGSTTAVMDRVVLMDHIAASRVDPHDLATTAMMPLKGTPIVFVDQGMATLVSHRPHAPAQPDPMAVYTPAQPPPIDLGVVATSSMAANSNALPPQPQPHFAAHAREAAYFAAPEPPVPPGSQRTIALWAVIALLVVLAAGLILVLFYSVRLTSWWA